MLYIQLFGAVALGASDSDVTPVVGVHPTCLLATLALHSNRPYTRDELIDLMWPEEDQDTGRQRFRQALYALRQQIDQVAGSDLGILHATRTTVSIASDRVEIDVVVFESALAAAASTPVLDERVPLLERAVGLYRGELAPGVQLEPILSERNRLAEAHLKALHLLTQAYEGAGQIERALETAHRAIAANPLLEEAYCDLMRLYSASGQPSAVVRQYQELERILEAELGERPSAATRALMESLRRIGMDRVAERPQNGARDLAPTGVSGSHNGAVTLSASVPVEVGPTQPVITAPVSASARRRWPLVLVLAAILASAWFAILSLSALRHRRDRGTSHPAVSTVPAPRTLWERRIPLGPGDADSEPTALAVAADGSGVYVVGFVQTAKHDVDFVILSSASDGKLQWQRRYNGPGNDVDRARSVSVDQHGGVFVTGESDNGRGNSAARLSGLDIATIKYSYNNQVKPFWVSRYNGPGDGEDRPCRVMADGQGGCIVAGYSWDGRNPDRSQRWVGILLRMTRMANSGGRNDLQARVVPSIRPMTSLRGTTMYS